MQTLDFISGLHNCLEFSQPLSCIYQAMQARKTFSIALILVPQVTTKGVQLYLRCQSCTTIHHCSFFSLQYYTVKPALTYRYLKKFGPSFFFLKKENRWWQSVVSHDKLTSKKGSKRPLNAMYSVFYCTCILTTQWVNGKGDLNLLIEVNA